jgi:hypothetical protein
MLWYCTRGTENLGACLQYKISGLFIFLSIHIRVMTPLNSYISIFLVCITFSMMLYISVYIYITIAQV